MFVYVALFVACFVLALLAVWFYKSLAGVGKAVYQAILPSSKRGGGQARARATVKARPAGVPWGWKGGPATSGPRLSGAPPRLGRPLRDEGRASAGEGFRALLRLLPGRDVPRTRGKPWGW